MGREEGMEI